MVIIILDELAQLVASVLDSPDAVGKTFEVRRDETESGKIATEGKPNNWNHDMYNNNRKILRSLIKDSDRSSVNICGNLNTLPPFPRASDPPGDVSEERKREILNDPRVIAVQQRDAREKQTSTNKEN